MKHNNGKAQGSRLLFSLGQIVATPGALEALTPHEGLGLKLLMRHVSGDWGNVNREDAAQNDLSAKQGFRILSSYTTPDSTKIWIITESDRSVTTLLLPSEY